MSNLPYKQAGEHPNAVYHVVPDTIKGGWNVYATNAPQEPQVHFDSKEEAVIYAERKSVREGVGFSVEESESPQYGR
jgi:hypothetical protein